MPPKWNAGLSVLNTRDRPAPALPRAPKRPPPPHPRGCRCCRSHYAVAIDQQRSCTGASDAGSASKPPVMAIMSILRPPCRARQHVKAGHTHRDAHFYLLGDRGSLGSSATPLVISTPRFIGPGCITSASGLAFASRFGFGSEP